MGSKYTVFTPKASACAPVIENRALNTAMDRYFMSPIIPDHLVLTRPVRLCW
jgi:hypothetical protein